MPEPTSEGERTADALLPKEDITSRAYEDEHDLPEPDRLPQSPQPVKIDEPDEESFSGFTFHYYGGPNAEDFAPLATLGLAPGDKIEVRAYLIPSPSNTLRLETRYRDAADQGLGGKDSPTTGDERLEVLVDFIPPGTTQIRLPVTNVDFATGEVQRVRDYKLTRLGHARSDLWPEAGNEPTSSP